MALDHAELDAMRIVGGRHRGRRIVAPEGRAVRPTADRTREALFDILTQGRVLQPGQALRETHLLDAFAGSGALGLEALSRGAPHVTFMESFAPALAALRQNVLALGELERASVYRADVLRPPRRPAELAPCGIVLMDPPYNQGLAGPALEALAAAGWLAPGALVSVELMKTEAFEPPAGFELVDQRKYGRGQLIFLRYQPPATEDAQQRPA
ncbi:MAG: 16S rRNA (guanine(966)-N(2))-methyltransferase RsmD [Kiloniellales bacterium]